MHKKFTKKVMDIAKSKDMYCQIDVEPGDTGTECWATQVARYGIPTALISVPVKYMHTMVEMVCEEDLKNIANLINGVVCLSKEELEDCLCY